MVSSGCDMGKTGHGHFTYSESRRTRHGHIMKGFGVFIVEQLVLGKPRSRLRRCRSCKELGQSCAKNRTASGSPGGPARWARLFIQFCSGLMKIV